MTGALHVPKHIQNVNKIPTIYFDERTFLHKSRDITQLKIYEAIMQLFESHSYIYQSIYKPIILKISKKKSVFQKHQGQ